MKGEKLDRSETLILKTNGKLGFGSKEGNMDRGKLLRWSSTKESWTSAPIPFVFSIVSDHHMEL